MVSVGDRGHNQPEHTTRNSPPVKIGGVADTSVPSAVDDGDRVQAFYDTFGRQTVVIGSDLASSVFKTALINATSSGNTEIVAAVAGKKIRVINYLVTNDATSTIRTNFQSSTTAISATHTLAARGGGHTRQAIQGWTFETVAGEALNLNLSASGTVGGDVGYVEV